MNIKKPIFFDNISHLVGSLKGDSHCWKLERRFTFFYMLVTFQSGKGFACTLTHFSHIHFMDPRGVVK